MNAIFRFSLGLLLAAATLSSCSEWFDVSPKTNVKADDFFSTEGGFQSALSGIYTSMSDPDVYGGDLSFGLLSQLTQEYDLLPTGATQAAAIYNYRTETSGFRTKSRLAATWLKSYNLIANANNLLHWLDRKGEAVVRDTLVRSQLRGEALALRAYLHFDLLRAWGPMNFATSADSLAIPYRSNTDGSRQPRLSAKAVAERILADLATARQLLSNEAHQQLVPPYRDRRYRLNYYAVVALQARVFNYMGRKEEAIQAARTVIDHAGLQLQVSNEADPILFDEAIAAVHMHNMRERLSSQWAEGPKFNDHYYAQLAAFKTRFGITGYESEDIRAKSTAFVRHNDIELVISRKYINNQHEAIPLIRLPEMYYILAECLPLEAAAVPLNLVRNRRGYSTANNLRFTTEAERLQALDAEYRKEFYAEGQYFFFLKRHSISTIVNAKLPSMGEAQYVFPLPDAEVEYGWTAQ